MRRYDELIEVRRGLVAGQEAPEQFIWRDRLWVVRDVVSHWVETGAWWDQAGISALLGVGSDWSDGSKGSKGSGGSGGFGGFGGSEPTGSGGVTAVPLGADLLAESERWRVEAMGGLQRRSRTDRLKKPRDSQSGPPRSAGDDDVDRGYGVFDLAFDWVDARWRLLGCAD